MNILELNSVSFQVGKTNALSKISFGVKENSIHCILGQNGAGKSTIMKIVSGLLRPTEGFINVLNKPIDDRKYLKYLGSLIEGATVYGHLNVYENMLVPALQYNVRRDRIFDVLNITGLTQHKLKKGKDLSMGMKQRLGIGMAIIHNPKLLLLDEPTNGLDPEGVIEIRELLKLLNSTFGVTILFTSHILSEVDRIANEVTLVNKGVLIFTGSIDLFKSNNSIESGYLDRIK